MEMADLSTSALSLLPPILAITLAILTRRVLLSLGSGIILGALLLNHFSLAATATYMAGAIQGLVWDDGLNTWNLFIILFLLILGVMTTFISMAGGSQAFGDWALQRIRNRRGAQLVTVFLGLFIFIDDYFNSLAVGNISRPLTDRFHISRAKLAYLIDSTAAPICVISPISSWGAYIIALIGTILAAHGLENITPLTAFLEMVPMNFYALLAVGMVFTVTLLNWNFGPMKTQEDRAESMKLYQDAATDQPAALKTGRVRDLVVPIVVLIAATTAAMLWTGTQALAADDKPFSVLGAFENTDVAASLVYGGLVGLTVTLILYAAGRHPAASYWTGTKDGIKSMRPAIAILFFAWAIIGVIDNLGTGKYLASLIDGSISSAYLPFLLFIVSGLMAFATGTSWGTFGIMLPIAGDIAAVADPTMMMPVLAAVLAGSVFGDHCSPISDTTILSSTGAGCHHIDHVVTQLPYTLITACLSAVGYLVLGLTHSVTLGLATAFGLFSVLALLVRRSKTSAEIAAPVAAD